MDVKWVLRLHCLFFLSVVLCYDPRRVCTQGLSTNGYTDPKGDIALREGETLNITCVLNRRGLKNNLTSDDIYFYTGHQVLPSEKINSTAIRLVIEKHQRMPNTPVFCQSKDEMVCLNVVVVGVPPQDIIDFDCLGDNLESITCSWIPPDNHVKTTYSIDYTVKLQGELDEEKRPYYYCPEPKTLEEGPSNSRINCTWSLSTQPVYRHSHEFLYFRVYASNIFGNASWDFSINTFSVMRPWPPKIVSAVSKTPHSVDLVYTIPNNMLSFAGGLTHRISWCIEESKKWTPVYVPKRPKYTSEDKINFTLSNLPYAHCLYDIRVALASSKANKSSEKYWSNYDSITIRTLSKIPDCPPNTTLGSFKYEGTNTKYVFWQNIRNHQENGLNFSYFLQIDEEPTMRPVKIVNNYAKFQTSSNKNLTVRIWSTNHVGMSQQSSLVFIPARNYALREVDKLIKVDKGNGEYDLEWIQSRDPRVTNYTLFWCSAQKEKPHYCDGTLQWEIVPPYVTNKTVKLPTFNKEKNETINIYQFAISANGRGTSSGMLWADCTVIPGAEVKLRHTYVKRVSPTEIVLQWELECMKKLNLQGFNVSYCVVEGVQECAANTTKYRIFEEIEGLTGGELVVDDLSPYTGYKLRVKPIVSDAESQFSDPMVNATWETAPSVPRDLTVLKVTDSSVKIRWMSPEKANGLLISYTILFNGTEARTVPAEEGMLFYEEEFKNLLPRLTYNITVKACTKSCNQTYKLVETKVGYPETVRKPSANFENDSLIVKWEKPGNPLVPVDYYEVEVRPSETNAVVEVHNVTGLFYAVDYCQGGKNGSRTVKVSIRALNIDNGRTYWGKHSETADFPCTAGEMTNIFVHTVIYLAGFISVLLLTVFCYRFYRALFFCRKSTGKLPPGLEAMVSTLDKKEPSISDETLPGEPLLPECGLTDSQIRQDSGESSGCSSATASVISAVESRGSLSITSDSGNDQAKSPSPDPQEVEGCALRQRQKKIDVGYVPVSELPTWTANPHGTGYSVVGVISEPKESDVIPMSDFNNYVSHDKPVANNGDYVVADISYSK